MSGAEMDSLAQEIRRVDGNHDLGAGALAEALMPWLAEQIEQALEAAAKRIEAERNRHWQARPLHDGDKSAPRDYAIHDALYRAARIVREGGRP